MNVGALIESATVKQQREDCNTCKQRAHWSGRKAIVADRPSKSIAPSLPPQVASIGGAAAGGPLTSVHPQMKRVDCSDSLALPEQVSHPAGEAT